VKVTLGKVRKPVTAQTNRADQQTCIGNCTV